jgi:hypothetical protein
LCDRKIPESQRAAFKASFEQNKKAWRDAASNPYAKAALAVGCKTALDAAKEYLADSGCK